MPRKHVYTLKPGRPTPGLHNLLRPPIASCGGTGILTSFPSTTRFRLVLGADSPCADERCAGNLGLTATELFTLFIATHVSIRTSDTSSNPYRSPSQAYGTLSYRVSNPLKPLLLHLAGLHDSMMSRAALSEAAARLLLARESASSGMKCLQVDCSHPRFRCTV